MPRPDLRKIPASPDAPPPSRTCFSSFDEPIGSPPSDKTASESVLNVSGRCEVLRKSGRSTTLLCLDVGEKRIGVAVGDSAVRIAVPFETIEVDGSEIQSITELVASENASLLVIGYPRNQSGEPTAQTKFVEDFAARLDLHKIPTAPDSLSPSRSHFSAVDDTTVSSPPEKMSPELALVEPGSGGVSCKSSRLFDIAPKIVFQDESLTSVIAEQQLASYDRPYSKGDIDAQAAAIILQDYLEAHYA